MLSDDSKVIEWRLDSGVSSGCNLALWDVEEVAQGFHHGGGADLLQEGLDDAGEGGQGVIAWLERRMYGQIANAMIGVLGKDLDLQFVAAYKKRLSLSKCFFMTEISAYGTISMGILSFRMSLMTSL
jgi:hypothetical protein